MNKTCLYFHINTIKQEIFYVGIGDLDRPYKGKSKRSNWWYNITKKYNYDIIIIHENLTWKDACELEIKYITQIGRKDLGLGTLVNMTDGGDGTIGYKHTQEFKDKISKIFKQYYKENPCNGSKNNMFNKNHTVDTKNKISKSKKNIPRTDVIWNKDKTLSDTHKNNISTGLNNFYENNESKLIGRVPWNKNKLTWTKELCHIESLKYKTRSEFSLNCQGAYRASIRNKWIDEFYLNKKNY